MLIASSENWLAWITGTYERGKGGLPKGKQSAIYCSSNQNPLVARFTPIVCIVPDPFTTISDHF